MPKNHSLNNHVDRDSVELPDLAAKITVSLGDYIQAVVKKTICQETAALHNKIEKLESVVNAMQVELKVHCNRVPRGELFTTNMVKYIKLEEEDGTNPSREESKDIEDEENNIDEEEGDEMMDEEDIEDYEPTTQRATTSRKRKRVNTLLANASQYSKYKRWRARVEDVVFDLKKIGSFHYEHEGIRYDLSKLVHEKSPNTFTNTAITSAAKDVTKYFLSMIIGDTKLHLYTSSSRTRRSYEPIPVKLQNCIKDLIFSGAVSYTKSDVEELKKCIANAVETAIYDKCSYARKHPEKRMGLKNE